MFKVTVCSSSLDDTAEAVGELIAQGWSSLAATTPQAAVLLNQGHEDDTTLLAALHDTWPHLPLIGSASLSNAERRLSLLLLSSPDLNFSVGVGQHVPANPAHAAEQALSTVMPASGSIALCLTLPESLHDWSNVFAQAVRKLLPAGTPYLNELLPHSELKAFGPGVRQYHNRKVLTDGIPLLVAAPLHAPADDKSWRFTRQRGIVRKSCGEHVYEYDTLIGDRRQIGDHPRVA